MKFGKLELTAFITGMAILVVEISSARIISPYLGNTFFTWTSTISVILGALSIGYFIGGKLADSKPNLRFLPLVIFCAAISISTIPIVSPYILGQSESFGYEFGPLLASLLLLTIPNVLLGMVEPFLVKMKASNVRIIGNSAGTLYAISTVGGIIGALCTGYVLIPNIGLWETFFITGIILAMLGVVIYGKKGLPILILVIALVLIPTIEGPIPPGPVVYQTDTEYYHLEVINYSGNLALITGPGIDTILYKNDTAQNSIYKFQRVIYDVLNPHMHSALYLGLGGGAMIRYLYNSTNASIDAVEIDPGVISVAERFFNIVPNNRIAIYNQDARYFLDNSTKKYDMIVLDSYETLSLPYYMTSVQAAQEMEDHLAANGTLFINVISSVSGQSSCPFKTVYKTFGSIFPNLYVFPFNYQNLTQLQNVIIIASTNKQRYSEQYLYSKLNASVGPNESRNIMENYYQGYINTTGYPILTDNLNNYDNCAAQALQPY